MLEMAAPQMMARAADVVVTAQKRVASQEELGDLKLYRVPMRVDVNPSGLKQVLLLEKKQVPFEIIYSVTASPYGDGNSQPLDIKLRMRNREKDGLGVPLPSGSVIVMQHSGANELLLAEDAIGDRAVDEKVELSAGQSDQVRIAQTVLSSDDRQRRVRLTITNALDRKVPVEVTIPDQSDWTITSSRSLSAKGNDKLWDVAVPANGERQIEIRYRRP